MREPTTLLISSYEYVDLTVRLLKSIQQYPSTDRDEILIMDDGSSQHTLNRLLSIAKCTVHTYCRQAQPSLPRLRAEGRALASHDWVMWLDNDVQWLYGDPIEALQNTIRSDSTIGAIQPIRITKDNQVRQANFFDRNLNCVTHPFSTDVVQYGMYPEGACWLSHKETFDRWNYDKSLCGFEDSDIGFQMYFAGLKCACVNTERVWHQEWGSNLWHVVNADHRNRLRVIDKWAPVQESFFARFR